MYMAYARNYIYYNYIIIYYIYYIEHDQTLQQSNMVHWSFPNQRRDRSKCHDIASKIRVFVWGYGSSRWNSQPTKIEKISGSDTFFNQMVGQKNIPAIQCIAIISLLYTQQISPLNPKYLSIVCPWLLKILMVSLVKRLRCRVNHCLRCSWPPQRSTSATSSPPKNGDVHCWRG